MNMQYLSGVWLGPESQSVVLYEGNRWYTSKFTLGEELCYIPKALKSEREENLDGEGTGQKGVKVRSGHQNKNTGSGQVISISDLISWKTPIGQEDGIWTNALAFTHPANRSSPSSKGVTQTPMNPLSGLFFKNRLVMSPARLESTLDLSKMAGQVVKGRPKSLTLWPP